MMPQRLSELQPRLKRLLNRVRYGLIMQEILDRLARLGIVIYPYFVSVEPANPGPMGRADPRYRLRLLRPVDAASVSRITLRKSASTTPGALARRMERALCIGAFWNDELVGYTWIGFDGLPTPGSGRQWLFSLFPNEACTFDLYVIPDHRGNRVASLLRDAVSEVLESRGCTRALSTSLAFNRAVRRFQKRAGAREAELRLYLHVRLAQLPGLDVRVRGWERLICTPLAKRVPALKRASPAVGQATAQG